MVDRVRRAGGFDVDPGTATSWVNDRYQRLAVGAGWTRSIGVMDTTNEGDPNYDVPPEVEEILELKVNGQPYSRKGVQTLWDLQAGKVFLDRGGIYAPNYSLRGEDRIALFPTPSEDSLPIEILAVICPAPLAARDTPLIPADLHYAIVEGAMADAFAQIDENLAAADRYEARFDQAIDLLRRRRNRKVGGGPSFVQIEGVHFRR